MASREAYYSIISEQMQLSWVALHLPVLTWGNAVLLLKSPEERGIVCKADLFGNTVHQDAPLNQGLRSNQTPLCNTTIETDTNLPTECLGNRTFTDEEVMCNICQCDFLGKMLLHICQDLIQQFRLFCFQGFGGHILTGSAQMGKNGHGVADYDRFPAQLLVLRLLHAGVEKIADIFPTGVIGAIKNGGCKILRLHIVRLSKEIHKVDTEPKNIAAVRLRYRIRKQRTVAGIRWNQDNITLLQLVTLCADHIFGTAAVVAADQFIKGMAVELKIGIGVAYVNVRIHIGGIHLQFLVKIMKLKPQILEVTNLLFLDVDIGFWCFFCKLSDIGYFHKNHPRVFVGLVILYHKNAGYAILNAVIAIKIAFII